MADTLIARRSFTVNPQHAGKRMSLTRFAHAETAPGHLYELERGVVVVSNVPGVSHERILAFLRRAFARYEDSHSGLINLVSGGQGCVMRMWELQSERHPGLTVYLSPPPSDEEQTWDEWTPDLVIEVVSKESRQRDYVIKREDYLAAGVRQYWIIDPNKESATLLIRRGDTWREIKLDRKGVIRAFLLPGFSLRLSDVLAAGSR